MTMPAGLGAGAVFGDEVVRTQDLSVVKGRKTGPAWREAATSTSLILGTRDLVLTISAAKYKGLL